MKRFVGFVVSGLLMAALCASADDALLLEEVVVTPTGSKTDAFDTSLPVSLVTRRDIEETIAVSAGELLKMEPGVDAVTIGPGSIHPMIRGLHGERVLVLVDGGRLSEERPGGNHVLSLDSAQIERVEIMRGPASVLYGSDAIGGVINFITHQSEERVGPELRASGDVDVTYQSNGEGWKSSGNVWLGKDRFNLCIGGVYTDTKDIENRDGSVNNSAYKGGTIWAGANYIGEGWKSRLDYTFMDADIGIPSPDAFAEDLFQGEKHHRLALRYEMDEEAHNTVYGRFDLGWQRHNRHRFRRKVSGIPAVVQGDMLVNIWLDIDTYTFKPQVVYLPTENQRITAGVDVFYEDASSDRTIRDSASSWVNPTFDKVPVIPDSSRLGLGVFAQDEIFLGDCWVVTPGLRYDWIRAHTDGHARHNISDEESSENGAVSGNLGILYKVNNELNLYANAGRAFRAPTLLELYFYGPHDVANDIGDPDLDPETSWNFDVGVKTRTGRLKGMCGVFYNLIDDYIVKEKQEDGDYLYKNYAKVYLYGGEAGLEYDLGAGFSTFGSVSYVRGKNDDTGENLPSIPPLKARYGVRYDYAFGGDNGLWMEVAGVSAAKQDKTGPNENETDGYTLGNIRMGVDLGEAWSLMASVENFADVLYQDHLSAAWQAFGMNDQPGRNVKVMAKAAF